MKTDIYIHEGFMGRKYVGYCKDGNIYSGTSTGWSANMIGEYKNGEVFYGTGWNKKLVGGYKNGEVYEGSGWNSKTIGKYKDGTIYSGYGFSTKIVANYEGIDAGAAAAAFLLLLNR